MGSQSSVSNSLNHICQKYNIYKFNLSDKNLLSIGRVDYPDVNGKDIEVAQSIKEFISLRESNRLYDNQIPYEHINDIILYLCTS